MSDSTVYADNAATSRMHPMALAKYGEIANTVWGNPSSLHIMGTMAHEVLENARRVFANTMSVTPDTIYFTGSGTESNNIALRGVAMHMSKRFNRSLIVTTSMEHSSVRRTVEQIGPHVLVNVTAQGYVDEKHLFDILQANANHVAIVSIIMAQSEVGTLQRIPFLARMVHDICGPNVPFHTDATQAFGKHYISPSTLGIDLLTASAHKFHGPKGVGILYARKGLLDPKFLPITGGGQERGCRSGTENVPAIAAAATALHHMLGSPDAYFARVANVRAMRDYIVQQMAARVPGVRVLGDPMHGLYNLVALVLPGVNVNAILRDTRIAVGSGSACNKGKPSASLIAMGRTASEIKSTVRISLSEFNTMQDCEKIVTTLSEYCK